MKKALLILSLFIALSITAPAQAYELQTIEDTPVNNDFILGPGKTDLVLDPGEKTTKQISITNRLGKEQKFKVEIEDFSGSYDTEQTVKLFGEAKGPYSLKDYIHPEVSEFSLKHGERIIIPVNIEIPQDSQPGGLYASVLVSTVPSDEEAEQNKGQTKIISRLGTLFFLRVSGDVTESGSLQSFKLADSEKSFYEKGPIPFEIIFKNDGNVHLAPSGKIEITNLLGKKVGEVTVDSYFAMPNAARRRVVEWDRDMMFGMYTAKLTLDKNYQTGTSEPDVMSFSFWVMPWKTIVIVLIVLAGLLVAAKKVLGNFKFEVKRK